MEALLNKLTMDMQAAMRSGDKGALTTIRSLIADIKNAQISSKQKLNEQQIMAIIVKAAKQRKDSIAEFEKAKRDDLITKEKIELNIIKTYLPKQLSEAELTLLVNKTIEKINSTSIKDMGKIMAEIKSQTDGSQDMGLVSKILKSKLS